MNLVLKTIEKDSEWGYAYWVSTSEQGITIITRDKRLATVIKEGTEIRITGPKDWEAIKTNKKVGYYYNKNI
jgi:hypothetical protein